MLPHAGVIQKPVFCLRTSGVWKHPQVLRVVVASSWLQVVLCGYLNIHTHSEILSATTLSRKLCIRLGFHICFGSVLVVNITKGCQIIYVTMVITITDVLNYNTDPNK